MISTESSTFQILKFSGTSLQLQHISNKNFIVSSNTSMCINGSTRWYPQEIQRLVSTPVPFKVPESSIGSSNLGGGVILSKLRTKVPKLSPPSEVGVGGCILGLPIIGYSM